MRFDSFEFARLAGHATQPNHLFDLQALNWMLEGRSPASVMLGRVAAILDIAIEQTSGQPSHAYYDLALASLAPSESGFSEFHGQSIPRAFGFYDLVIDALDPHAKRFGAETPEERWDRARRECDWNPACWFYALRDMVIEAGEFLADKIGLRDAYESLRGVFRALDITNPKTVAGHLAAMLPFPIDVIARVIPGFLNCLGKASGDVGDRVLCFLDVLKQFVLDKLNLDALMVVGNYMIGNIPGAVVVAARAIAEGIIKTVKDAGITSDVLTYMQITIKTVLASGDMVSIVYQRGVGAFSDPSLYSSLGGAISGVGALIDPTTDNYVRQVGFSISYNAGIIAAFVKPDLDLAWKAIREQYVWPLAGVLAQGGLSDLSDFSDFSGPLDIDKNEFKSTMKNRAASLEVMGTFLTGISVVLHQLGMLLDHIPFLGGPINGVFQSGARDLATSAQTAKNLAKPVAAGATATTQAERTQAALSMQSAVQPSYTQGSATGQALINTAKKTSQVPTFSIVGASSQALVGQPGTLTPEVAAAQKHLDISADAAAALRDTTRQVVTVNLTDPFVPVIWDAQKNLRQILFEDGSWQIMNAQNQLVEHGDPGTCPVTPSVIASSDTPGRFITTGSSRDCKHSWFVISNPDGTQRLISKVDGSWQVVDAKGRVIDQGDASQLPSSLKAALSRPVNLNAALIGAAGGLVLGGPVGLLVGTLIGGLFGSSSKTS
jgi:hypothetical protein